MRKTLLATSALALAGALAAGPASAADMPKKLTVGVGGYMQQWIGVSGLDSADGEGGVSQYSDSEIFFRGKLEADSGLTFSVKVEFEGNTHTDVVDESQVTVGGSFGQIVLGSEDDPTTLMHYGTGDVGVGLNCGDASFINGLISCARSGEKGLGTAGHLIGGDSQKIAYYTPRLSGVQFGVSYSPESVEDSGAGSPVNNDNDAVSLGLNYTGAVGDTNVSLSVGHYQKSQVGAMEMLMSGSNAASRTPLTASALEAHETAIAGYEGGRDLMKVAKAEEVSADAGDLAAAVIATNAIAAAQDISADKADSQTFTNFGIQVGMGAFSFSAAYAVHDGGTYKVERRDIPVHGGSAWDHDGNAMTPMVADDATYNDPDNDTARTVLVKDASRDYEVASAGVTYSDGPMAVSLAHMMADADDDSSVSATMLSGSYTLAPGIKSQSSVIFGEQDAAQGTAFVTGITLSF